MGENPASEDQYELFVSYAHADDRDGFVSALVDAIRREHAKYSPLPLAVFLDRREIRTMQEWEERILGALRSARVMLSLVSPAYFQSRWCRREWEVYREHDVARAAPGGGIAPIYLATAPEFEQAEPGDDWHGDLRRRQYLELRERRAEGPGGLGHEEALAAVELLYQQMAERIERARRARASPTTAPAHNPRFVGRVAELGRLRKMLALGRVGAITALHGVGGIGKTALAFEYAHGCAADYPGGRFLVHAEGVDDLRVPIINLAPQKGITLSEAEQRDLDAAFARVRAAFERGPRSLLLLDNVDRPGLLAEQHRGRCLPGGDCVHVLVTTRLEPGRLPGVECLPLDALPEPDALRLLENHRRFGAEGERRAAEQIVRRLGGHALAVEVVAVYLWQFPEVSYADYLARLQQEGLGAVEGAGREEPVQLSRHPQKLLLPLLEPTLATLSPAETAAVEYAAVLPPEQIAVAWLRGLVGEEFPDAAEGPRRGYPDPWRRVVGRLLGLRLLVAGDEGRLARMHRLLQEVVRARMAGGLPARRLRRLAEHAQQRGDFLWESWVERDNRWEIEPLRQFALLLMQAGDPAAVDIANWLFGPLSDLGRFGECRDLLRRGVATAENQLGADHPTLASSYSNLALVERALGNPAEARELLRRALAIDEKAFEPDQPTLATRYSNLATVEKDLGNPAEARELLRRALAIDEKAFEPDHPTLATSYSNLALVEQDLGNPAEARELLRRAVAIKEKVFAPDHPTLATSYSNLAYLEAEFGNQDGARELMHRAYGIRRAKLGEGHPHTQASRRWLAEHDPGFTDEA